jgi:hypothetical protein
MKWLRKIWLRWFPQYRRLEIKLVTYAEGDRMIRDTHGKTEAERWHIAIPEEDINHAFGLVYLERKERITK